MNSHLIARTSHASNSPPLEPASAIATATPVSPIMQTPTLQVRDLNFLLQPTNFHPLPTNTLLPAFLAAQAAAAAEARAVSTNSSLYADDAGFYPSVQFDTPHPARDAQTVPSPSADTLVGHRANVG